MLARTRTALLLSTLVALAGCASTAEEDDSAVEGESAFTGTPNDDIGQLFMIEHFGVEATGYADVHSMIRNKNLGALILWNPQHASGETARAMATRYAATAHAANRPEMFIAADQEEAGTQRFKSRHGFTNLVSASVLGRAIANHGGDTKVCELHARITSREMASAGMNMTLGTVSDIYTRDSGTPGMFRERAIGSDASVVASCIRAMTKAYGEEGHVVFITKHFPGLGNASGNTDVDARVRSYSDTSAEMENELSPYRAATAAVNANNSWPMFGAMISHSSYEILDSAKQPATLTSNILEDLLRAPATQAVSHGVDKERQAASFNGMNLKGLTVSDAFWTWGAFKDLPGIEKRRMMARSFLAGMDVLMIAKSDFNAAWEYFQFIVASPSQLPEAEQALLLRDSGLESWSALVAKFRARVTESTQRIHAAKVKVGDLSTFAGTGAATTASTDLVEEYRQLTR